VEALPVFQLADKASLGQEIEYGWAMSVGVGSVYILKV
jgi:hypothetical protein